MSIIIHDCPRCGASNATFDVIHNINRSVEYNWMHRGEIFCVCRNCITGSILFFRQRQSDDEIVKLFREDGGLVSLKYSLNRLVEVTGFVNISNLKARAIPEYLEGEVEAVFDEGTRCLAVGCWNAAGSMFRSSLDLATKPLLPPEGEPTSKIRRSLGLRLAWMFENGFLPNDLRDLAECVREDGNDGAHDGTLTQADAEDLYDFSFELLRRMISEPARVELARARRIERRESS